MERFANASQSEIRIILEKHRSKDRKTQIIYLCCLIACAVPGINIFGAIGLFIMGGEIGQHLLQTGYYYGMLDSKNNSNQGWSEIQK